uniref:Uncharacterized protein n=1 Tax=Romanomermis culicivorax TaxID=13658 RepID=A0A915IVY1_ROMCU
MLNGDHIKMTSEACDEGSLFWTRAAPKASFHEIHNDPHSSVTFTCVSFKRFMGLHCSTAFSTTPSGFEAFKAS